MGILRGEGGMRISLEGKGGGVRLISIEMPLRLLTKMLAQTFNAIMDTNKTGHKQQL